MQKILILTIILGGLFGLNGHAQVNTDLNIDLPTDVRVMVDSYIDKNDDEGTIDGYRIQLMSSQDKNRVLTTKTAFYRNFPSLKTYLDWNEPNFLLKAGDFNTKLAAQKQLLEVITKYPNAYIIIDKIEMN